MGQTEISKNDTYNAWFECIGGCEGKYSLKEIIYTCPTCGSLLQVNHDIKKLAEKSASEWKSLLEGRVHSNVWPFGSGVWGKKELVCPIVDDSNIVSMYEGLSNLFWADRLGEQIGIRDLWIKLCGNSHTGSFKDLGMTVLVSVVKQMISEGKNIKAVACASTGDTSAALAAYCAAGGIQSIVFLPKNKVSMEQLIQPIANDALVISLNTDFDGCMKVVKEITMNNEIYLANSMNSLRIEGQKTVALEMVQQFDWEVPDIVIIPGGNLGNVSALGKGFLMMERLGIIAKRPRIVVAQAEKANPLYLAYKNGFKDFHPVKAKSTLASAIQIGDPVSIQKAINILKEFDGIVEQASESELVEASVMADKTGMYTCPHTGVALAALLKLKERGEIGKNSKVVVISTAHGLKFSDFKLKYHKSSLEGIKSRYPNKLEELDPDIDKIRKVLDKRLEKNI
ncbi:MAG: threonine synthase [Nitrospinota bacterium]|nr:threonine synthase [Nitrospinota bacterium]